MKKQKQFMQWLGLFIRVLGGLWLFLMITAAIPNERIKENMERSAVIIGQSEAFAYCDKEQLNGIADNYADSIWINIAWYMGKGNPVFSSVDTQYYDGEQGKKNQSLYQAVTEETVEANTDYTRYWHGTAGIIRLLHLFTDVSGIRYLGFMTSLGLAAVIMILLIREGKDRIAVAFFISIYMIKIWNIRLSMEYQPMFLLSFLMCILYLLYEKRGDNSLLIFAAAGGQLGAFFDFLTTETMGILLPLILVISVRNIDGRSGSWKENFLFVVKQGSIWLLFYGMTFLSKWIWASVLTGENKFKPALSSVGERIYGETSINTGESPILSMVASPAANLSVLFEGTRRIEKSSLIIGVCFVILFLTIVLLCLYKGKKENRAETILLFLLGSMVFVRFMILNNHSYLHAFFTYRALVSTIMAMLSIIIINVPNQDRPDNP